MFSINWLLGLIPSWVPWAIIGFGVALFVLVQFFKFLIPVMYRFIAVIVIELLGVILFASGFYIDGRRDVLVDEEAKINQVVSDQKDITKQALDDYIKTHEATKAKNETIIKYITTKDDSLCKLPGSFIRLHNYAATNTVPNSTGPVNGTTTGVTSTTGR
jgi:hypothetical protein